MNSAVDVDNNKVSTKSKIFNIIKRFWHIPIFIGLIIWYYFAIEPHLDWPRLKSYVDIGNNSDFPHEIMATNVAKFLKSTGFFLIVFTGTITFRLIPQSNGEPLPTKVFIQRFWHIPVFIGIIVWYFTATVNYEPSLKFFSDLHDTIEWNKALFEYLKSTGLYLTACTFVTIFRIIPKSNEI